MIQQSQGGATKDREIHIEYTQLHAGLWYQKSTNTSAEFQNARESK